LNVTAAGKTTPESLRSFGQSRASSGRRSLDYGLTSPQTGAAGAVDVAGHLAHPQKYLSFQKDLGGWNNILMQFEIMVVLAWITGRTLVLPPATPFYLLGEEPRRLEDFLDLDALHRHIPVLTAGEFASATAAGHDIASHQAYHDFMRSRSFMPPWHGLQNILLFPADALQLRPQLKARLAGPLQTHREPVALSMAAEDCEILYFPMIPDYRMFGVAECFFLFGDASLERSARRLLRDAIRYRPDIIRLAEAAINSSPLCGTLYSAMHVRRGDFQYEKTQIAAEQILTNTQALLSARQPVYVATDEADADFLKAFREKFEVITFQDLPGEIVENTPHHWCGIVETLICAAAQGRFIGTRLSTFSARIATLRGHLAYTRGGDCEGIDTNLYYTQPPLHGASRQGFFGRLFQTVCRPVGPAQETSVPWWLSKDPPWARAYEACWAETDA
jgi:hypothetical protein